MRARLVLDVDHRNKRKLPRYILIILYFTIFLSLASVNDFDAPLFPHDWQIVSRHLIAHGGAAVERPDTGEVVTVSNTLETLSANYEKGYRAFEYDLNLTTDKRLAAVHQWDEVGGMLSREEWLGRQYEGLTTMMLEDILDFMAEHEDMYLITDTKSFFYSDEDDRLQFEIIYDEANRRDPALINRIIPQIYNQDMYYLIKEIYQFPSVIYTLYVSTDTNEEVIDFVRDKKDINTIVLPEARVDSEFNEELSALGKVVYTHTINDLDAMRVYLESGVYGFYTDLVTPEMYLKTF